MKKKVAVVGMAYRLPGEGRDFWQSLLEGDSLVTQVEPSRWSQDAYLHPAKSHPGTSYTFAAGSVGDIAGFDAAFFGISPREAALMDPQQRLLLEMSWEALEGSGIRASAMRGSRCGVFIGISSADYIYRFADDFAAIDASTATGNTSSIAANRISYVLDLRGPSMAIDTACSSSLVAFHQACQSIACGESTMALTGGVSLHVHPYGFVIFSKASMLSPKGRCNVFDASGDGYVRSEGGGIFVLKDYALAVADGDQILAVVEASAVNTDGRKSGLTVPSHDAQTTLLREAYEKAGIDPSEIDYVEAHGTGTAVGDPIETRSLGEALGQKREADHPLLIGSVKSNVGHLEPASGVAGLVKAIHVLQHRTVPATIGIRELNPHIRFDAWNLEVVRETTPLKREGRLVVGVNSFGFGGANAHVVLSSGPVENTAGAVAGWPEGLPLVVSGRSKLAARSMAGQMAGMLERGVSPYALAYHQVFRRDFHAERAIALPVDGTDAVALLRTFEETGEFTGRGVAGSALASARGPVFVYSGNGSQWEGMGRQLLADPVFEKAVTEVDALFAPLAGFSLRNELLGAYGEGRYVLTEIAQPALFALQVGVTAMLHSRGIRPAAVVGHSVGEVAAAWAAGALDLPAAVRVIYERSAQQGKTRGAGQMTAVACSEADAANLLEALGLVGRVSIAGVNGPRGVTLAGEVPELDIVEAALREAKIGFKRLDLEYAFHSPAMDAIEDGVRSALADLQPRPTDVPLYSTVLGDVIDGRTLDADYWWRNIRRPVVFAAAIGQLIEQVGNVFVEIGPHAVLRGYVNDCLRQAEVEGQIVTTLTRGDDAPQKVWQAWGALVIAGVSVDWAEVFPSPAARVSVPAYPWQRERLWHARTSESLGLLHRSKVHPLLGYRLAQHALSWENQLDTVLYPALADHVVGEAVLFPGTGFLELALAAATQWKPLSSIEVHDLEVRAPLVLSEQAKTVRTRIDDADGALVISARSYAQDEAWNDHAACRVLGEAHPMSLQGDDLCLPTRVADFDAAEHARLIGLAGLHYGPAFAAVREGWVDDGEVIGVLQLPEPIVADVDQYLLHPALLDCSFQLIIHLLAKDVEQMPGVAFVPTRLGRVVCKAGPMRPERVRARLVKRSPHSLTVDFTLHDGDGILLAHIKEARFRSVRLQRHHADHVRHIVEALVPLPHPSADVEPLAGLHASLTSALRDAFHARECLATNRRYVEEAEPLLDTLSMLFVQQTLKALPEDQAERLRSHLPVSLIESLPSPEAENVAPQDVWNALLAGYPDYFPVLSHVGRQGLRLEERLSAPPAMSSVQDGPRDWPLLVQTLLGGSGRHALGVAMREVVGKAMADLPPGERLRVVEVVVGAAPLASELCHTLDFDRCDYTIFADGQSLPACEELRERCSGLRVEPLSGLFDESGGSGFAGAVHLAILNGGFGLHNVTEPLMRATGRTLAPQGALAMIGVCPSRWMDFAYAGDPSWWQASEKGACRDNQLLPPEWWRQHAEFLGFADASVVLPVSELTAGVYLLTAAAGDIPIALESPGVSSGGNWLLVTGAGILASEWGAALGEGLTASGGQVTRLADDTPASLEETLSPGSTWKGIVVLSGFSEGQPEVRCALAAQLAQLCEKNGLTPELWFAVHADDGSVDDAALRGFARTLMNEAAGYVVRLLELKSVSPVPKVIKAGVTELSTPTDEREVHFSVDGVRHVPRLRLETGDGKTMEEATNSRVHLGFHIPGQLRNLCWMNSGRIPLAVGQIEIEVRATGLNFRDVMYALGLLSDEAVENGFAGATLGLECAGVVAAVGPGVKGLAVGDRVVAFGPACFANYVVTDADAASLIPGELSFEAAATIPSTFLTAYYALHHLARLSEGERVLVHGGAGGVGIAAIQIAKWCGAEVFATAGSDEKRDFLRLLGVDRVFDSRSLAYADEVMQATGGAGVDVVLNSLAGEAINRNFQILKPFGRFLELGKRDYYENTKVGLRPFRNNISYFGIDADQLMAERPDLTRRLFGEVMALFKEGILHPLPFTAFDADAVVDAFRHMQQARQTGKIVVTYAHGIQRDVPKSKTKPLQLEAQASYLVTGGLRGFGLRTARWLAEKGARHLVLISRSGLVEDEARQAVDVLRASGVHVVAEACDVTDAIAMKALFARIHAEMPPLRGIVHAAMVIDDGLIRGLDVDRIARVLAPKLEGARILHRLTEDAALDFFVLFSSATTLFGNPGQASYVAANAWLEAFARMRRARGLPALSVAWGAIDDAGFLARNAEIKDALQGRMGGLALKSEIALANLEYLLGEGRDGRGVLDLDWRALSRFLPMAQTPRFRELAVLGEDASSQEGSDDISRMLQEMSYEELLAAFVEMLKGEVAEILRIDPQKLDPDRSIYDMGLDSLMGVELVTAVESRFGVRLPVMALSESPTIHRLAAKLLAQLKGEECKDSSTEEQISELARQHGVDVPQEAISTFAAEQAVVRTDHSSMIH